MSGLSFGTVIIEASSRSGCLLTAEHAVEQGRDIFCIPPHDINDNRFLGVVGLLRDGAIPTFSYLDIVNEYLYNYCHMLEMEELNVKSLCLSNQKGDKKENKSKEKPKPERKAKTKHNNAEKSENKLKFNESDLETLDKKSSGIMRLILKKPVSMTDILSTIQMEYMEASEIITNLELNGYITRQADGKYTVLS